MKHFLAVLLAVFATGCSFDLALPEQPQRGRLLGKIDTQGHITVEGHTVVVTGERGERVTQLTQADGSFIVADLPPGLYLISFKLPGFAKLTSDLLRVIAGQDTDAGTFTPDWLSTGAQAARVKGMVGLKEGKKGDINGTKVEFLLKAGMTESVVEARVVSQDGEFVTTLPPGTYDIRGTNPLYETETLKEVVLPEGGNVDLVASNQLLLMGIRPAYLEGTIMEEVDGADPQPCFGATVTLKSTGENAHTDVQGKFKLQGLTGGDYEVTVEKPLGGFHDTVPSRAVTLIPLQTVQFETVTLQLDRGNISGTVSTGTTPVAGARVEVSGTPYIALVSPDPADATKGSFLISGIPVKDGWNVIARKDQFSNATATAKVTKDATTNVGVLTLARLLGDFLIDDSDTSNTPGYTRTLGVTLDFAGFPPTGITGYRASEDPNFASFDGGFLPYSGKLQPFTLSAGEGLHTVYAQYDINGQSSQPFSSTIFLDTVAPSVPAVTFDSTGSAGNVRYTKHSQNLTLQVLSTDGTGSGVSLMRVGDTLVGTNVDHATEPYKLNAVLARTSVVDGPQNVYVQVIDFAGNISDAGSDVVIVDTIAPTGSITLANGPKATDPGFTNTTLLTVNETWADSGDAGVVLVKFANTSADLNAAVYQPTSPSAGWFLDPLGEGTKTVWAKFRDTAGNETMTAASASITYDVTPPTPAAIAIVGATTTNNPSVTVSMTTNPADLSTSQAFTLSDESTFTSSGKVGPSPFPAMSQSPFTFSPGDGVRTVYARFRDKAGNDSITSTQLTLDTVAPSGSFTVTGALADGTPSSTLTSTNQVTVNLSPGGATEYRLGDASMTSCPTSGYTAITTTTLTNQTLPAGGVMTLCLRDAARNAQGPLTQSLTLDSSTPTGCAFTVAGKKVDGSAAPAGLTALTNVTATIGSCTETPTEMFVSSSPVTCANGLAWVPFSSSNTVSLAPGDGPKNVYGCVRDSARNFASITSGNISLDTAGPSPASATLVGSALTNASSVTVNLSATDSSGLGTTDAVTASEDPFFNAVGTVGPQAFPGTNQITVNLSATDGAKTIYVRFRDRLQNSTVSNITVTRDTAAPSGSFTVTGTLADGTASSTLTSTNQVTVSLVPSGASEYRLGDATMSSCPSSGYTPITTHTLTNQTLAPSGVMTLCLRDGAGNAQGPLTQSLTLDSTTPTGCAFSLAGRKLDGSAAPAGLTALTNLTASIGSCAETPTEMFISSAPVTCANSLAWVPFSASNAVSLSTGDGAKNVYGCVRDAARNFASITSGSITLDTAGPTPASATLVGSALTNASSVTLNLSATDSSGLGTTDAVTASEDPFFSASGTVGPSAFPGSNQVTVNLSAADGDKTIYVRFRDRLQNATVANVSVTRDGTAPSGSVVIEGNLADGTPSQTVAAPYLASPPTVKVYLSSGSGANQYAFVPTAATACASASYAALSSTTLSTPLLIAGNSGSVQLCLKDAAGNTTASPLTDTISYFASAPTGCTLSLAGVMADGTASAPSGQSAKAVVTATVSGCSATAAQYYLANGTVTCSPFVSASYVTYTGPSTGAAFLLAAEGSNTVSGCVRDAAGNVAQLAQATMSLDTTPPSALGLSINSDAPYFNASQLTLGQRTVSVAGSATGATEWAVSETTPFSSFVSFTGAPMNFTFPADGNPRTLYAQFKDALGNLSTVVNDNIVVDTVPPDTTGVALALVSPTGNNFVNSVSATVNTSNVPADATSVQLAEDLITPAGCTAADFAGASTSPVASSYSFVLNATNGGKTICGRWYDAAGNVSGIVSDNTKTLDTVAPPIPVILVNDRVMNPFAGNESLAQLVPFMNVVDPQHGSWQVTGGAIGLWTDIDAGNPAPSLPLTAPFTLRTSGTMPQGFANVLQIREKDLAGNVSDPAQVTIIADTVPPQPVTLSNFWVDNASGSAVVRWQDPTPPGPTNDISGYYVYYGAAPGNPGGLPDGGPGLPDGSYLFADGGYITPLNYNGFYATQGSSPVEVNGQMYATLDNLPNGALTYATVRAVDHAGNIGLPAAGPTREVLLQPNEVSPNLIMEIPILRDAGTGLGGFTGVQLAVSGDYAFMMAGSTLPCGAGGYTVVQSFDLSTIVSPVQGGGIFANPPVVTSYPPVVVQDGQCTGNGPGAMVVEYPFMFTAAGTHFRVWNITDPKTPVMMIDKPLGTNLNAVEVRGRWALVAGNNAAYQIDLSALYDNNNATRTLPTTGTANPGVVSPNYGGITWWRNRAIVSNSSTSATSMFVDMTHVVDSDAGTALATSSLGSPVINGYGTYGHNGMLLMSQTHGNGSASGYYKVIPEQDGFRLYNTLWWDWGQLIAPANGSTITLAASLPFGAFGQQDTVGHQTFMSETSAGGLVSIDVSNPADVQLTGITRASAAPGFLPKPSGLATYGNYAIQATEGSFGAIPTLRVYEIATPRGLRSVQGFDTYATGRTHVVPGFAVTSSGMVVNLWGGATADLLQVATPAGGYFCQFSSALFDDTLVSSYDYTSIPSTNGQLRLTALDSAFMRNSGLDPLTSDAGYLTPATANTYMRGLERVGNYLLVNSWRGTGIPGQAWLEAYRATGLRTRMPYGHSNTYPNTAPDGNRTLVMGATPGLGDKVSEYMYNGSTTSNPAFAHASLRVTNSSAVVAGDNHVYIINISPLIDDDQSTGMSASNIQGDITPIIAADAVLSGNRLYVLGSIGAGTQSLHIYDASNAVDGNTGTTVTSANLLSSTPIAFGYSLDVHGSYALVASYNSIQGGITSVDVSNSLTPKVISYLPNPIGNLNAGCSYARPGISVVGSRAYVGYTERFDIFDLE